VKYLLDTCVLGDFARGEPGTQRRLKGTAPASLAISVVTAMEIEYGLLLNPARARKLAPVMRALVGAVSTLGYNAPEGQATAALRVALRKKGRPIGAYDVLIAATALARGLVLVTANYREFSHVSGLVVENWRE
jgi:tRNA(fMet)-specific endonuclease VapC